MKVSLIEHFLTAPQYRLLRHLLLIFFIVLFGLWGIKDVYTEGTRWFPVVKFSLIILLLIYFNIYILTPLFLVKRRWYWVYLLIILYVVLLVYFIDTRLNDVIYLSYSSKIIGLFGKVEINPLLQIFTLIIPLFILMISSSAMVLLHKWALHNARANDLEKDVENHTPLTTHNKSNQESITKEYIFVRADRRFVKINYADITFVEALKDYVIIRATERVITRMNLNAISEQLPADIFLRVNKSYIINTRHITSFDNNSIWIGSHEILIGDSYRNCFFNDFVSKNMLHSNK